MSLEDVKVGDRLRNKFQPTWPDVIVTELTDEGFKYEYVKPQVISPRIGTAISGESFGVGVAAWERVATEAAAREREQEREEKRQRLLSFARYFQIPGELSDEMIEVAYGGHKYRITEVEGSP